MDRFIKCARNNTYNFFFKRYFVTSLKHLLLYAAEVSVLFVCCLLFFWVGALYGCVCVLCTFKIFFCFCFLFRISEQTSTKNRTLGTKSFCKIFTEKKKKNLFLKKYFFFILCGRYQTHFPDKNLTNIDRRTSIYILLMQCSRFQFN